MFMDTDGIPDDMDGANVILALALGNADNVELWNPDRFVPLERVRGGGVKGIELLAEIVGMPEGVMWLIRKLCLQPCCSKSS